MTTTSKVATRAERWGVTPRAERNWDCRAVALVLLLGPALVFGVVGYLLWGVAGLVPAAVALLVAFLLLRTSTNALVGSLDPRPAEEQRLLNIVTGLSSDLEIEPPDTFIVRGPGRNALVFWHHGRPALGVTPNAATGYARTELEAVVAHLLARLDPVAGGLDHTALRLGGMLGACAAGATESDDVRAAAITRYPPALSKAIEKADPVGGRFAYLWFVGDEASVSREARVAALSDL